MPPNLFVQNVARNTSSEKPLFLLEGLLGAKMLLLEAIVLYNLPMLTDLFQNLGKMSAQKCFRNDKTQYY